MSDERFPQNHTASYEQTTQNKTKQKQTMEQVFVIRILVYDEKKHQFSPDIDIQQRSLRHGGRMVPVSLVDLRHAINNLTAAAAAATTREQQQQQQQQGINLLPSAQWMQEYKEWNNFFSSSSSSPNNKEDNGADGDVDECTGHPVFASVEALYEFNDKGAELVARLRQELATAITTSTTTSTVVVVKVEDYVPLFSNIKVGDVVSAWWHIKDQNYNYVVPVQHLPVSDTLKSRIMAWRHLKGKNWLDDTCCRSLNEEGHDIEEHILWELNVRYENNNNNSLARLATTSNAAAAAAAAAAANLSRQSSFESVHHYQHQQFAPVHQAGVVIE